MFYFCFDFVNKYCIIISEHIKEKFMKSLKIFRCEVCGNICVKLVDSGVPMVCCARPMKALTPNTVDAASEKHKPVVKIDGNNITVQVGEVLHPMTKEHYISMIIVETNKGFMVKNLTPNNEPNAEFVLYNDEKLINTYAYCNLHGLWK